MISAEDIAEIRRLFFAEHWKIGTIAAQLNLHPETVRGAIHADHFGRGTAPRATLTDPYPGFIRATLAQYPRLRATRLYEMIKQRGYTGSVIQLRRVVAKLRPAKREAFFRLSALPGEQAQADWACFGEVRIGRARRRLSCFVLTLSYSRALCLEFFLGQNLESLLLAHANAFTDWGRVPRVILYGNMRSAVLERHGEAVHFHPRLLELSAHYHFAPRPCRPARGNEKGRVERAIQYIRHSFFAARSFSNPEEFNVKARARRDGIACARPWPSDDSRTVAQARAEEQPYLLPLPQHPFETDLVRPVRSDKTIYVRFDLNDYSIPPAAVGKHLTLGANPEFVRVLDGGQEIARHRRSYDRGERIDDPAHIEALPEQKRKALGATAASRLEQMVPSIAEFLDAAFARGESAASQTKQLLKLPEEYGAAEVEAAVREAIQRQTPRATSAAFILTRRRRAASNVVRPAGLSRHPHLQYLAVPTHQPEIYDELTSDGE
ncbi:MAG: IS21 family transposase [Blastocatellia bacterium]